jgi:error-prone DNA polymerase
MNESEHVVLDYAKTSLSLKAHPVSFVREKLEQLHVINISTLPTCKDGQFVRVAGFVLLRQRPGTAKGVCFMTIQDETGFANVVFFESLFEKYRKEILQSRLIMVEGKLQIEGEVIHVIVSKCYNISGFLKTLTQTDDDENSLFQTNNQSEKKPSFHKGRNFH